MTNDSKTTLMFGNIDYHTPCYIIAPHPTTDEHRDWQLAGNPRNRWGYKLNPRIANSRARKAARKAARRARRVNRRRK
jgi:hypothetical protein